jgi:hypothetical protein
MCCSAYGSKARHLAAKGGMGFNSEPVRARLKDVRTRPSKALSAHLFFVAFCRNLLRTRIAFFSGLTRDSLSYTGLAQL